MKFQEKLVALRKGKGMSQEQLAEKLGVSKGGNAPFWHTEFACKV